LKFKSIDESLELLLIKEEKILKDIESIEKKLDKKDITKIKKELKDWENSIKNRKMTLVLNMDVNKNEKN